MASSSSSSSSSSGREVWKYDVFLSFRGEDTRNKFTSHLYKELRQKGIYTFKDDRELTKGEPFPLELPLAIDQSRILLIIFSKNYASSTWCLEELLQISKRKEAGGRQTVLPIFYDVTPSDVRNQKGDFGKAFDEHKGKIDDNKVQQWRIAAKQIAYLSGWELKNKDESDFIEGIVRHIIHVVMSTLSHSIAKDFVGMKSRLENMIWYLDLGQLDNVKIIGICGMGGIGKTTIASVVYKELYDKFEGRCFLADVRETSEKYGLVYLQNQLLSATLMERNIDVYDRHRGADQIRHRLNRKKVLVILDDVSKLDQIEILIGRRGETWFGPGSRIIITTRDESLLIQQNVDKIYRVKELNDHEALQLFRLKAIQNSSKEEEYMELSERAVNYAQGNPLALKVLGSFLFGRGKHEWESALHKLGRVPQPEIFSMLRASFDTLDEEEQCMFLDIACFFTGQQVDFVQRIMDGCGFSARIGISVLVDKCLITILENKLDVHDLLQEMAHEIVRQESIKELGKRSRLWSHADVHQVLTKNLGSEKVEGIFLDTSKIQKVNLSSKAFVNMHNLRLLKIYGAGFGNSCKLYLPDGLDFLSDKLIYLHWEEYPLSSMPPKFEAENLVELNLIYSNVKQLWSGMQHLVSLKEMNLSNCKNLLALPDLSLAKNLENLIFAHCTSLAEVHPSIQFLDQLVHLDMRCCTSLLSLPTGVQWRSLKTLNLSGCSYLRRFPEFSENLTYLNLNETAIEELPESIGKVRGLITLNLKDCKQLQNLPESMHFLKALVIIDLSGCSNITRFPKICGEVKYLYLSGTAIVEIPSSIGQLSRLFCLDLMNCKRLKNLPSDISRLASLEQLVLSGCSSITKFPEVSMQIKKLCLDGTAIEEIPSWIQHSFELVELNLQNCTRLHTLPSSICKLKHLQKLNLSGCCIFENFPKILEDMYSLRYLYLDGTAIKELPSPIKKLKALSSLELKNCRYLCLYGMNFSPKEGLQIQYLRKLYLNNCGLFVVPHSIGRLSSLEALDLSGNPFIEITSSLKGLFELQYLGVRNCIRLKSLPQLPPNLTRLDAHGCLNLSFVSMGQEGATGNIFEFIFTNCNKLTLLERSKIESYALTKFKLYAKRLFNQVPSILAGESCFFFPRFYNDIVFGTKWMWSTGPRFATEIQLPSGLGKNDFLGFISCAFIAFHGVNDRSGLRVKCKYHFQNENGDFSDFHCYFGGWYDKRIVTKEHVFVGYDPCDDLRNNHLFDKYRVVNIELYLEDISGHPLQSCSLVSYWAMCWTKCTKFGTRGLGFFIEDG